MHTPKLAIFVDAPHLHATARALGIDIDFKRLLVEFQGSRTLVRAFYYTPVLEDQQVSSIRPLIDWLEYNGFTVVTKETRQFIDASGNRKLRGRMNVELAVDAMELVEYVDEVVLFSGEADFRALVAAIQRRGVRVTVVSSIACQPPMAAAELRRQADVFIDLSALQHTISSAPVGHRAPRETQRMGRPGGARNIKYDEPEQ